MKKFFPALIIMLLLFGISLEIKGEIIGEIGKIQKEELQIKIQPIKINENISYSELIKKDQNKDGFFNQLDDSQKLEFKDWKDILDHYLVYLNTYRPYDTYYQYYKYMDLNLNYKIEEFEDILLNKMKEGKEDEYLILLEKEKDKRNISEYQYDRANYALMNYLGLYQKKLSQRKKMAEKYPKSPFKIIQTADFHNLNKDWFKYSFNKNEPEWFLSEYLNKTIVPRMHHYYDYMELIFSQKDEIFPHAFSDDFFMQKLSIAFIWYLEIYIGIKSNELRMTINEDVKKNLNDDIKLMKNNCTQLDIIWNYISNIRQKFNFVSDQVDIHRKKLSKFEKETNADKIMNFNHAIKLLQDYIKSNSDIDKNEYHFVISALLKNHIKNLKDFDDYGVMFSPDMMFTKGKGVCADQSPALALMLKELTSGELDAKLYCWYRKYFHGHISMIYQNYDGFYYFMDQDGIQAFHYSSRDEAVHAYAPYAHKYRESVSLTSPPGDNKKWASVFYGKNDSITSPDDKLTLKFDKIRDLE